MILDLQAKAFEVSELDIDSRWKKWVKWVDSVNPNGSDGYAFEGKFVRDGAVEIKFDKTKVLLVASTTGSRKYHTTHYQVLTVTPEGELSKVEGLATDNATGGWALRLRDQVIDLLASLEDSQVNPLEGFSDAQLMAEIERRNLLSAEVHNVG